MPESPEGVALALVTIILGAGDLCHSTEARNADEVLGLYRRCLAATRGEDVMNCPAFVEATAGVH